MVLLEVGVQISPPFGLVNTTLSRRLLFMLYPSFIPPLNLFGSALGSAKMEKTVWDESFTDGKVLSEIRIR